MIECAVQTSSVDAGDGRGCGRRHWGGEGAITSSRVRIEP